MRRLRNTAGALSFTAVSLSAAVSFVSCAAPRDSAAAAATTVDSTQASIADTTQLALVGAGATFPYPLYSRWFNEYGPIAGLSINYHSVGSAAGIAAVLDRTVDFGATDVPMTNEELKQARTRILHVPTAIGAVGVTYQLPTLRKPLRLTGDVMADLFLGRITRWNHPRLQQLNPDAMLPDVPVTVVHRDDGSGTTYIFTQFLSAASPTWAGGPGQGRRVEWPVGMSATGNEGVAGEVKATEGAVGYVEVVYARQNRLPIAHVRNPAGRFISPLPFEIATAAASVLEAPTSTGATDDGFRRSLVNAPGAQAYPIASFTWMLVAPDVIGRRKTAALTAFLTWAFDGGADVTSSLGYVPLPAEVAARVLRSMEQALPK